MLQNSKTNALKLLCENFKTSKLKMLKILEEYKVNKIYEIGNTK